MSHEGKSGRENFNARKRPSGKLPLPLSLSFPICETNGWLGKEGVKVELLKAGKDIEELIPTPVFKQ